MLIYKIFRAHEWAILETQGSTTGAPVDVTDGYIHFSTAAQAAETAAKHFAREEGLVLLGVTTDTMDGDLRWEKSRGGALFPHLYRDLRMTDVVWHKPLPLGPDGHCFPEEMV